MNTPAAKVTVRIRGFLELFKTSKSPLAIDTYQRPYVWSEGKVKQLVDDLRDFAKSAKEDEHYYIGTVLLHRDHAAKRHFVIDGQQRLTTLCVLHHVLHGALPENCDLAFRNPVSRQNIKAAHLQLRAAELPAAILSRIRFTLMRPEKSGHGILSQGENHREKKTL